MTAIQISARERNPSRQPSSHLKSPFLWLVAFDQVQLADGLRHQCKSRHSLLIGTSVDGTIAVVDHRGQLTTVRHRFTVVKIRPLDGGDGARHFYGEDSVIGTGQAVQ